MSKNIFSQEITNIVYFQGQEIYRLAQQLVFKTLKVVTTKNNGQRLLKRK